MARTIITRAMRKTADEVLARSTRWAKGTRNADGLRFYSFTSSRNQKVLYMTSVLGCTCPGFTNRGICCHSIAVTEAQASQVLTATMPAVVRTLGRANTNVNEMGFGRQLRNLQA